MSEEPPDIADYNEQILTGNTRDKHAQEAQAVNAANSQENSTQAASASREAAAVSSRGASQNQDDASAEQQRNALYKSMQGKGENVETREKHEKKLPWQDPELKDGQSKFFDHPDKPKRKIMEKPSRGRAGRGI